MPDPIASRTAELRDAVLKSAQALRRRGAEDPAGPAPAQTEHDALARRYAEHRILNALGPDPKALEPELFRTVLYSIADPAPFARTPDAAKPSALEHDTMTAMLLAPAPIGELLDALRTHAAPRAALDPLTTFRRTLRRWAAQTAEDPFVAQALRRAAAEAGRFEGAVADADAALVVLTLKHNAKNPQSLVPVVDVDRAGQASVSTSAPWAALAQTSPADAERIHAALAEAELAAARLRDLAADLNRELARFFAELVPRCFALIRRLSKEKRREQAGFYRLTPARSATLVRAAAAADFAAEPGSALHVPHKAVPHRLEPLTREPAFARARDAAAGRKAQNGTTVAGRKSGSSAQGD